MVAACCLLCAACCICPLVLHLDCPTCVCKFKTTRLSSYTIKHTNAQPGNVCLRAHSLRRARWSCLRLTQQRAAWPMQAHRCRAYQQMEMETRCVVVKMYWAAVHPTGSWHSALPDASTCLPAAGVCVCAPAARCTQVTCIVLAGRGPPHLLLGCESGAVRTAALVNASGNLVQGPHPVRAVQALPYASE